MALVAAYNFDAATGTTVADLSGNGNDLTLGATQEVTWSGGGLVGTGTAFAFGGGNNLGAYKSGDATTWINPGGTSQELTISFEFKYPATGPENYPPYVVIGNPAGTGASLSIAGDASGYLATSYAGVTVYGVTGVRDGVKRHFHCVITATTITNYVDNVQVWTGSRSAAAIALGLGFSVLGKPNSSLPNASTNGFIDNLRIRNHAADSTERAADIANPVGTTGVVAVVATGTGDAPAPFWTDGTATVLAFVATASGLALAPTAGGSSVFDSPGTTAVGTGLAVPPSVSGGNPDVIAFAVAAVGYRAVPAPVVVGGTGTPGQFDNTPSLEDLIQEVLLHLHGFSTKGDQVTSLSDDVTATARTFTVDDADTVSRGILEIGDELVRVQSVDRSSGVVTVLPKGRGWRGTLASKHEAGDTITMAPLAPRQVVAYAINDTIASLYPDLFGVDSVEFPFDNPVAVSWQLPAEAEMILSIRYRDILGNWQKVRTWELENVMSPRDFESGKGVRIYGVPLGQTVQVVYGKVPTILPTVVDKFSSTGLLPGWRDIVVLGAQARIIPSLDTARLSLRTVSADQLDQPIQLGSAVQLAKDMRGRFQQRVAQERAALLNRYPAPVHFTR